MAAERGMIATFMPKPFAGKTGSGLHLHLSLTSGGTPVFPADDDDAGPRAVRPRRTPSSAASSTTPARCRR